MRRKIGMDIWNLSGHFCSVMGSYLFLFLRNIFPAGTKLCWFGIIWARITPFSFWFIYTLNITLSLLNIYKYNLLSSLGKKPCCIKGMLGHRKRDGVEKWSGSGWRESEWARETEWGGSARCPNPFSEINSSRNVSLTWPYYLSSDSALSLPFFLSFYLNNEFRWYSRVCIVDAAAVALKHTSSMAALVQ